MHTSIMQQWAKAGAKFAILEALIAFPELAAELELNSLTKPTVAVKTAPPRAKRRLSPAARKRIGDAARKRWAAFREANKAKAARKAR